MDHKPPRDGNKGRRTFPELKSGLRRYPLHVYISLLFSLLIIIAGTILGWHNYLQNTRLILETADKLFAQLGAEMRMKEEVNYASLKELVSAMSYQQINQTVTLAERLNLMPYLREELRSHPSISSLYFGYDDGSFFLVRPLRAAAMRSKFAAPPGAEYLVQSVERIPGKAARKLYLFFDAALKEIGRVPRADYTYDPRHRHWYRQAVQAGRLVYTDPYVFFTTREIGVTFSRRSANGHSVVAVDATLEEVSKLLLSRRITPSSRMVWFDGQERVMALDQPELLIKQAVDNGRG